MVVVGGGDGVERLIVQKQEEERKAFRKQVMSRG